MIKKLFKLIKDSRPIRMSVGQLRKEATEGEMGRISKLIDEVEEEYYKYGEPEACEPSSVLSTVRKKLGVE